MALLLLVPTSVVGSIVGKSAGLLMFACSKRSLRFAALLTVLGCPCLLDAHSLELSEDAIIGLLIGLYVWDISIFEGMLQYQIRLGGY